jgi:hypothetical protein
MSGSLCHDRANVKAQWRIDAQKQASEEERTSSPAPLESARGPATILHTPRFLNYFMEPENEAGVRVWKLTRNILEPHGNGGLC